ncbi:MAG: hypothetical protein NC187_00410 [Candidatus Amulumruptor caecigallinarius]|nr:hypothetical protein [Candidatus Amulumruptor caecigallinarius]MCM1395938.1 hypothetical protein [Candidatus Amulumruptor caecigallinarius]MCM1452973.1 hypothetical protein [bacterium]
MKPATPRQCTPYSDTGNLPRWVSLALGGAILFSLLLHFWAQVCQSQLLHWNLTLLNYQEFLINFEGGPVRRGLLGELLLWSTRLTVVSPILIIQTVCIAAYVAFTLLVILRSRRAGWCWWLCLSPLMCGYLQDVIRKDYIQLLLLLPILALCAREKLSAFRCAAVGALMVLEVLLHEAFIFWGAPLPLLILLTSAQKRRDGALTVCIVLAAFLLQCYWHGDSSVTEGIVASWRGLLPHWNSLNAHSIGGLDWELLPTLDKHFHGNFHSGSIGWWQAAERALVYIVNSFVVTQFAGVFTREASEGRGRELTVRVTRTYLLVSICMVPMFTVLSCDFGRLYLYLTSATVLASMIIPADVTDKATGRFLTGAVTRWTDMIDRLLPLRRRRWVVAVLLLVVGDSTWGFSWSNWFSQTVLGALWIGCYSLCTKLAALI